MAVALIAWSYFAELDEVSTAEGEVVPQGQVKTIQHLEGGIIEEILVREGDPVKKGDPVVRLNLLSTDASRAELSVRIDGFQLMATRLKAQATGKKPQYGATLAKRRPALLALERRRFEAYEREVESTIAVLKERTHQRALEVKQIRSRRATLTNDLELGREEFAMSTRLLEDGLTSKLDHLKLRREIERLEGELKELADALPRAEAAVAESKEQIRSQKDKYRRLAGEDLGKVELDMAQTREALARATDRVKRLEITAPIDGIVKSLRYHTIGGVVRPGEAIMEIVPTQEKMVVEARLKPMGGIRGAFTTEQSERYDARLEVEIDAAGARGLRAANAVARAERSRTIPEDATLSERETLWYELSEKLMLDFDRAMEAQIRKHLAALYDRTLAPFRRKGQGGDNVYQRYVIDVPKRLSDAIQYLRRRGIEAKRPIFKPLHVYLGLSAKMFPRTEWVWQHALSLPIYPDLTDGESHRIGRVLRHFLHDL